MRHVVAASFLLHRQELIKIERKIGEAGLTVVPLSLYFKSGRAKVEIGVARGKREFDKRQTLREKQDNREALRAMRERNRGKRLADQGVVHFALEQSHALRYA